MRETYINVCSLDRMGEIMDIRFAECMVVVGSVQRVTAFLHKPRREILGSTKFSNYLS